jgi:hypothetical protein
LGVRISDELLELGKITDRPQIRVHVLSV